MLAADAAPLTEAPGLTSLERLEGLEDAHGLTWLARFECWRDALAARDRARDRSGQAANAPAAPYLFPGDAVHQYLLATGRTFFGAMRFADLRRLALDIEVVTSEGHEFPSAARTGDRIVAIALADSTGWHEVLRGDRLDEAALLSECGRVIAERDPDVIEGHNIFRFDLEYIEARARRHGVELAWGRDGAVLRGRPARLQVAERTIGFRRYDVAGRHVVDTWMLAQLHDVGARDLPSFGLKDIATHWGVAAPERTYIDASQLARELALDADRVMAYAADDAAETLAVAAILAPPYFAQAQMLPFDYQSVTLRGTAGKIDALFMREYLRRRRAIPMPGAPGSVGGGLTAVWKQGVAAPVLHVDVTSLYPSLMLAEKIAPAADGLGVFRPLLAHLREFRVAAKRAAQTARDPDERSHQAALQASFKLLINSFYGYLAFAPGHWNDFAAADRVTAEGRRIVTRLVDRLVELGAVPVEADTDGVYFVPPPGHTEDGDGALVDTLASDLPAEIVLELDGRYRAMFSYKMKTYALLDARGRVTLKGSGFRSRGLEPFQRRLIAEVVGLLLTGRRTEVRAVIDRWLADFASHRVPLRLFARTETLGETLEVYRERVARGARPQSAAYELAAAAGRAWQPGDQVSYYVAGRSARVSVTEAARLASEWDPERPEENTEYYQSKVLEVWERFRRYAERDGLVEYAEDAGEPTAQLTLF
ncbi:MAG: DNA polymerase domain-containing protein [Candidatus Rokuibacteriota bacterium]